MIRLFIIISCALATMACQTGGLYTVVPDAATVQQTLLDNNSDPDAQSIQFTTNTPTNQIKQFTLASDFPASVQTSNDPALRDIAFIISVNSPAALLAVNLTTQPLALDQNVAGCIFPAGTGVPTGAAHVANAHEAFLLSSSHLISCDPSTGLILATQRLDETIALPYAAPLSGAFDIDGDGIAETAVSQLTPQYPAQLLVEGNNVWVSFSNYLVPIGHPIAAPGVVLRYNRNSLQRLDNIAPIVSTGFNPSGLTKLPDGRLVVVNSGVNTVKSGSTIPVSTAGIDFVNLTTLQKTWTPIGEVALAFTTPIFDSLRDRLYLASAAYNEIYAVDTNTNAVIWGSNNPLSVASPARRSDYLTQLQLSPDGHTLFAASFTFSTIYSFNIAATTPAALHALTVGHAAGVTNTNPTGQNTGIGGITHYRTNTGQNYLLALTAFPGQLMMVPDNSSGAIVPTLPTSEPVSFTPPPAASPAAPIACNGTTGFPKGSALPFIDRIESFSPGPDAGYGQADLPTNVYGPPQGNGAYAANADPKEVLSLGCGGTIIIEMVNAPILDGCGPDFIVFENAFFNGSTGKNDWKESAVVGVSSDGVTFTDFPCDTANDYQGCAGALPTLSNSSNGISPTDPSVAGGDSFDLADLGLSQVRFVRLRDISPPSRCGGISGGFELDAISVVWTK